MIYLDHNATTPMSPELVEIWRSWATVPANPSSVHQLGQRAAMAVDRARAQVASLVGGVPEGVVFTSGATEANHTGLAALPGRIALGRHEHPCVRAAVGERGTWLDVDENGRVALPEVLEADSLAVMVANHETGVLQPVEEALSMGVPVHVDASQAAGRVPLALGAAASVVLSSHKLGGPPGVGALVLPHGEAFPPLLKGGSQQRGRRAGTVNTAGVVAFGEACAQAARRLADTSVRWRAQQERLEGALRVLGGRVVGDQAARLPQTTLVVFDGIVGETLVQALDLRGICVSAGAACASGSIEPSPVLVAMDDPFPEGGVRMSFGTTTTAEDIEALIQALSELLPLFAPQ